MCACNTAPQGTPPPPPPLDSFRTHLGRPVQQAPPPLPSPPFVVHPAGGRPLPGISRGGGPRSCGAHPASKQTCGASSPRHLFPKPKCEPLCSPSVPFLSLLRYSKSPHLTSPRLASRGSPLISGIHFRQSSPRPPAPPLRQLSAFHALAARARLRKRRPRSPPSPRPPPPPPALSAVFPSTAPSRFSSQGVRGA